MQGKVTCKEVHVTRFTRRAAGEFIQEMSVAFKDLEIAKMPVDQRPQRPTFHVLFNSYEAEGWT